jgi:hypothetical protein
MTNNEALTPAAMAQPGSGYRFPPRKTCSPDLATFELRTVIIGWLKQAHDVAVTDGGIQELRNAVFRAAELTVGLSASEIAKAQAAEAEFRAIGARNARAMKAKKPSADGANGHAAKGKKANRNGKASAPAALR